ncbi:SLC12A4_6 [Lepeophtheirus salmonis]|uniref:SLC12A4_6 n=1 Tax=Lepeophtheirus salmonis TaxID=72036 RepID=A0A7R8CW52_LEPSM|nr:SLC12A4_6 [Lepeophtheirus salmonis]CAF2950113.1 SLC12A4_6 [Lepeophtheirus salmonis]
MDLLSTYLQHCVLESKRRRQSSLPLERLSCILTFWQMLNFSLPFLELILKANETLEYNLHRILQGVWGGSDISSPGSRFKVDTANIPPTSPPPPPPPLDSQSSPCGSPPPPFDASNDAATTDEEILTPCSGGEPSALIINIPKGDSQDDDHLIKNNKDSTSTNLYLYQDEERPHMASAISSMANYSATIQSRPTDPDAKPVQSANLGTLMGVYLPCIQNIFGVILFIRMTWIVGTAGAVEGFFVVFMGCCVTLLTAISMAAIATNAVGILFYLATSVAAAMYIIGAIEILIIYIVGPAMSLFGPDITNDFVKFNNYRVGSLACVLLSIVSIYVGIFVNIGGNDKANFCVLGTRIVRQVNNSSNDTSALTPGDYVCDEYFNKNEAFMKRGIRGLWNGTFYDNVVSTYKDVGDSISSSSEEFEYNLGGAPKRGYITSDIYTSFVILVGIFFPSCTGIMAGSNRSGDLADPQKSIPIGTIMAILTTSTVYLSSVLLFAATVDPLLLRDKFGESIGGSLVVGNIAWPHPKVVEIGSLLSTIGAGLQSLTGAPRLLQAIAKDGIIPFLAPFQVQSAKGEPVRALGITLLICEVAVLIGNVDEIAPLLSMFFLMCYGFVNLACALQTLLRTPNWRPRFKYYHWSLSLLGVVLCIAVMFMSSWYYALLAMGIAGIIYKYIEYRGAEKEWGDGIRGLALSAARFSLLRLEEGPPHTKNWRPQS